MSEVMDLSTLAKATMIAAKDISRKGEQVMPHVFVWDPAASEMVILRMPHYADDRELSLFIIRHCIAHHKADLFAFVFEAWLSTPKIEEDKGIRPSQDPNRKSAIMVWAASRDGEKTSLMCEIKQEDGKHTFEDLEPPDQCLSVFDNMFGTEKPN